MHLHIQPEELPALPPAVHTTLLESAAPTLVILLLVLMILGSYVIRRLAIGPFHDEEMDERGIGGLTSRGMRHVFAWFMRPIWRALASASVPPNAITALSLVLALTAGIAAASGHFALAGWLFVAGGALDFLDGRLARETGKATRSGAALDSVVDRYSDAALLVGLSWYYGGTWVLGIALLALTGSFLVPYVRARGEALGVVMKDVGVMQRPERVLLLGLGVALAPILQSIVAPDEAKPSYHLAAAALAIVAVFSHWTAAQRLRYLVVALGFPRLRVKFKGVTVRVVVIGAFAVAFDYSMMHAFVAEGLFSLPIATAFAYLAGAVVGVAGAWSSLVQGMERQFVKRAVFVAGTSALLNTGGVAAAAVLAADMDYHVVWLIVRAVVLTAWTVPLLGQFGVQPPARPAFTTTRASLPESSLARAPRF
jgi:phosphatidylglycerophosphate synthase